MMNPSLNTLVRDALISLDCDSSLIGDFDSHSTINLDFDNMSSISISEIGGFVWMWSELCDDDDHLLKQVSFDLLALTCEPCAFMLAEHPVLYRHDGKLKVKAVVHPDYLEDSEMFAEALDGFFGKLTMLYETVHR
ncbi:hypothetical protein RGU70_08530 [Herbaspirillum sp. RTI4]|uniref:InvB/SpaK family type III secretion system chaperone n=1 Tax=Herbaspirillum sp. RTI4 TaxID=3048640 RepID=UPI002AB37A4C|nr:hypothetical protein [Herbaspirillum sp. RTI4]MDY7578366.1 hypothetical protein [Herbaspirillum sp. RTI4]MEA9983518.1 hypothetical protein [Herbaspirillum sp. RTI4]